MQEFCVGKSVQKILALTTDVEAKSLNSEELQVFRPRVDLQQAVYTESPVPSRDSNLNEEASGAVPSGKARGKHIMQPGLATASSVLSWKRSYRYLIKQVAHGASDHQDVICRTRCTSSCTSPSSHLLLCSRRCRFDWNTREITFTSEAKGTQKVDEAKAPIAACSKITCAGLPPAKPVSSRHISLDDIAWKARATSSSEDSFPRQDAGAAACCCCTAVTPGLASAWLL